MNVSKFYREHGISRSNYYNHMKAGYCRVLSYSQRFNMARATAKRYSRMFLITSEHVTALSSECSYCGGNIGKGAGVTPLIGYVPGNVVSCCGPCNRIKGYTTDQILHDIDKKLIRLFKDAKMAGPKGPGHII